MGTAETTKSTSLNVRSECVPVLRCGYRSIGLRLAHSSRRLRRPPPLGAACSRASRSATDCPPVSAASGLRWRAAGSSTGGAGSGGTTKQGGSGSKGNGSGGGSDSQRGGAGGGSGTTGGGLPDVAAIPAGSGIPAPPMPSQKNAEVASMPSDVADSRDDDVVARQLREAAMDETDPVLKEKLWEEYRRYKAGK